MPLGGHALCYVVPTPMNESPVDPRSASTVDFMVVGLGASAGGLKALLDMFAHVPEHSGAAYVVVVHLSPEHESRMSDLLQQATTMPVRQVTETIPIQPNHVYVISPKSQLRIYDGKLEPAEMKRRGGAMTIDVLFETLAEAHEHRAVGVILSGTGSDGTLGMRALRAHGGITIAQAPEEAEYDSMPRNAIASGVVDFVLPVREIPEQLSTLWRNAQAIRLPVLTDQPSPEDAAADAEEAVRGILANLALRTGHDFSHYKRPTLLRRLARRLQVNQIRDLVAYRNYIAEHPDESQALLRDLLISVTWFFRDPAAWHALEQRVIPELLRGADEGVVRIWVAGCATGEEVYSLAILLRERVESMEREPTISIFATDIDEDALAFARTGAYPESIAENVSSDRLRRFFFREQAGYRVRNELREMVVFAVHNAIQDPPFSRLDLVLCRNLLIYLTRHVQKKVLDLLHFSLKPDGYLFLGISESVEDTHDGFVPLDKANHIYNQQPRARMGLSLATLPTFQPQRWPQDGADAGGRRTVLYGELHQRLLEHYAAPSIVVDDRYEIVHLSDRAGHFLQLGPGEPSLNLLKVAPEEFRFELKVALDQAVATMRTVECTGLVHQRGPQAVRVNLKVHPVRHQGSGRTFSLVILDEAGAVAQGVPSDAATPPVGSPETAKMEGRLREVESQLRAAIEQYEVQNQELKASNEELQATNEELRATTEELETGKEELQSINEELVTVNQELKNKVDETTRISDDLHNFVTATAIALLFVDRDMRLMRFTPFAREIFNVLPGDIGRPLMDITHRLENIDLQDVITRVFESLQVLEYEVKSTDGRWFIARVIPYRTAEDHIRGAALTFIDVTRRKDAETAGRRTEAWGRLVVDSVREYAIVTLDAAGVVQLWNPGARKIFGYEESEIIGENAAILFTPEDRADGVVEDEMRRARETGRAEENRWQLRKDGSRFFASGILAPLDDPIVSGYVKILRDLTDQKRAEQNRERLLESERVARSAAEEASHLKDEFLAMLSHELRNPLALLLMQAEILLRAPESAQTPRLKHAAGIIHEMVRAQAQLVDDMLDVSRARTGKLTMDRQLLPVTFVIADSIGALRRKAELKNIALDIQIAETPLIAQADPVRIRQIAWNLLDNALKFTPSGGTIRIRLTREGDDARLDIEDTGRGIAVEKIRQVFDWSRRMDPASQHEGGLGIGLALVRHLVDLHGGRIEVHSEGIDKGSRFTVWLPLQVTATKFERRVSSNAAGPGRLDGKRLLIVDDAQASGEALRDLLELSGAKVAMETSSREAIRRAKKTHFDVVISDVAMPELDGYAMLKAIRQSGANAHTPAIAYSGYSGATELERARRAGFDMHLTKPVGIDSLVDAILTLTQRESAADD